MIEQAKGDPGKVWKAVNEACHRTSSSRNIQCIISDGVKHITPKSIASSMNNFFASIGEILAGKMQTSDLGRNFVSNYPLSRFQLTELEQSSVLEQLLSLKVNKTQLSSIKSAQDSLKTLLCTHNCTINH